MKKDRDVAPPDSSILRVFIAIKLPQELRSKAATHIESLRGAARDTRVSWQRAENLHLTLKFIGEMDEARAALLSVAASRAAVQNNSFKLAIEGAGAFPPRGVPRVLWLGVVDPKGALARLQSQVEMECTNEGFTREEKPFRPHLTLARVRAPHGARELARLHQEKGFETEEFLVKEIYVMRSELGPGGSCYTEISRHELFK